MQATLMPSSKVYGHIVCAMGSGGTFAGLYGR
jgi:hypothetical protein